MVVSVAVMVMAACSQHGQGTFNEKFQDDVHQQGEGGGVRRSR